MAHGPTTIPFMRYADAPAAIRFLVDAFGFEEKLVVPGEDGKIAHAELTFGNGMVMLGSERDEGIPVRSPKNQGGANQGVYIVVADPDALYERAKRAGARTEMKPSDTEYGSRDFIVRDPEGNIWSFGTYDPFAPGS